MIRYVSQLFSSMGKHLGEPLLALLIAVTVGLLCAGAGLRPPVLPLLAAIVVFQFGVASWRLYRNQQVSIATTRNLRNLDELERVNSEQRLRAHYEHRERRLEQWHYAHVKRLAGDIIEANRQLTLMRTS